MNTSRATSTKGGETEEEIERRLLWERLDMLMQRGVAVELAPREMRELGLDPESHPIWSQTLRPPKPPKPAED